MKTSVIALVWRSQEHCGRKGGREGRHAESRCRRSVEGMEDGKETGVGKTRECSREEQTSSRARKRNKSARDKIGRKRTDKNERGRSESLANMRPTLRTFELYHYRSFFLLKGSHSSSFP